MGYFVSNSSGNAASNVVYGRGIVMLLLTSQNVVIPPGVFKARVTVLAAGGAGAVGKINSCPATLLGGSAGGMARGEIDLIPGTVMPAVIGAPGVGSTLQTDSATLFINGGDGGLSSFGGLSATGGKGGVVNPASPGNPLALEGMPGGIGIGGQENYTGGRGGARTINTNNSITTNSATGGGSAPTIFGDGFAGGDINAIVSAASAGGGMCGKGADITTASQHYSAPGGPLGPGVGVTIPMLPLGLTISSSAWLVNSTTQQALYSMEMPGQDLINNSTKVRVPLPRFYRAHLYPFVAPGESEYEGQRGYGYPGRFYNSMGLSTLERPLGTLNYGGGGGAACDDTAAADASIIASAGGYGCGGGAAMKWMESQIATAGSGGPALIILEM